MAGALTAQQVFGFLRPEQVNTISEASERLTLQPGDMVYEQGDKADHFFVVLDGEVTLRLPSKTGVAVVIDQLTKGDIFGGPLGQKQRAYRLSAQCTKRCKLLKVEVNAMKKLMEKDLPMGFHLQRFVATQYFNRYLDTMKKLQAIVMNLPIEA